MDTILKIDKLWHKTKWIHSIRIKLTAIYIAISILSLVLFMGSAYVSLDSSFTDERTKELLRKANITAVHIEKNKYLENLEDENFILDIEQTSIEAEARIIVCDTNGKIVADSSSKDIGKIFVIKQTLGALEGSDIATKDENSKVIITVPIKSEDEKILGVVYVEDQSTMLVSITEIVSRNMFFTSLVVLIIVCLIVFLTTEFITGPLKTILKVIDKMADGKFDEKLKVKGHDELAEVSMAFNQMSAKLQKIDANRQEFVSNVSHELKTPLSSMKVLIESLLLQDGVPEEMYKEFLGDINSEIDRLTDIINHLLTLVKIDVKVLPLSLESVNINEMVESIMKRLKPLAIKKGLELICNEEKEEIFAEIDKISMTLAISNLIENGIKYTDEGKVEVLLDADHQNMYITVSDTGVGMEEEEKTKIFDRFYRIDKTRDRETGGTGLGLAITHRSIILHNGSIKVTSTPGEGTTFAVRIPLKQQKQN